MYIDLPTTIKKIKTYKQTYMFANKINFISGRMTDIFNNTLKMKI